jgi:hypothetical protein
MVSCPRPEALPDDPRPKILRFVEPFSRSSAPAASSGEQFMTVEAKKTTAGQI